jgi:hypothetical protein
MRFMMFMIPEVYQRPVPPDFAPTAAEIATMEKFNMAMEEAGILRGLDGLTPPSQAVRASFKGGKPVLTDGPFAETKEVVGGYWIIEVGSREEAIGWLTRIPAADGDIIELRRIFGPEDFGPRS